MSKDALTRLREMEKAVEDARQKAYEAYTTACVTLDRLREHIKKLESQPHDSNMDVQDAGSVDTGSGSRGSGQPGVEG